MPVRIIATEATWVDCTQAQESIAGIPAQHLIVDKDYTVMLSLNKRDLKVYRRGSRHEKTEKGASGMNMTNTCIGNAIPSRTRFLRSNSGTTLLPTTPRTPLSSLPLSRSAVLRSRHVLEILTDTDKGF